MPTPGPKFDRTRLLILSANFLLCFSISFLLSKSGAEAARKSLDDAKRAAASGTQHPVKGRSPSPETPGNRLYVGVYEKILRSGYSPSAKIVLKNDWLKRWLATNPEEALAFYYRHFDELSGPSRIVQDYLRSAGGHVLNELLAGDFGLRSHKVAAELFASGAVLDPERTMNFIKTSGSQSRRSALRYLLKDSGSSPEGLESVVKSFSGLEGQVRTDAFAILGETLKSENPAAIKTLLLGGAIDPGTPEYATLATNYAKQISKLSVSDILKAGQELPGPAQDKVISDALAQKGSFIIQNADSLIESADDLIKAGKYDLVGQWMNAASQLGTDSVKLTEWALKLPQENPYQDVFQSAVSGYLKEDPNSGKDWIATLDNDWQKDQAMQALAKLTKDNPKYAEVHQWAAKGPAGQ